MRNTIHNLVDTGWRWFIGCLKLKVSFCKRATNYRTLLREMTYKDKASYGSSPLCTHKYIYRCACTCTHHAYCCPHMYNMNITIHSSVIWIHIYIYVYMHTYLSRISLSTHVWHEYNVIHWRKLYGHLKYEHKHTWWICDRVCVCVCVCVCAIYGACESRKEIPKNVYGRTCFVVISIIYLLQWHIRLTYNLHVILWIVLRYCIYIYLHRKHNVDNLVIDILWTHLCMFIHVHTIRQHNSRYNIKKSWKICKGPPSYTKPSAQTQTQPTPTGKKKHNTKTWNAPPSYTESSGPKITATHSRRPYARKGVRIGHVSYGNMCIIIIIIDLK